MLSATTNRLCRKPLLHRMNLKSSFLSLLQNLTLNARGCKRPLLICPLAEVELSNPQGDNNLLVLIILSYRLSFDRHLGRRRKRQARDHCHYQSISDCLIDWTASSILVRVTVCMLLFYIVCMPLSTWCVMVIVQQPLLLLPQRRTQV